MHLLQGVILLPEIQVAVLQEIGGMVATGLPLLENPVMEDQVVAGLPLLKDLVMEDQVAAGLPLLEDPVREDQEVTAQAMEIQAMGGPEDQGVEEQAVAVAEAQVAEARADTPPSNPLRTEVASKKIASPRT